MADTPKKSAKKAPSKKTVPAKPKKKAAKKTVSPDFYALRAQWMTAKEETAYRRRLVARADAQQSSQQDREAQLVEANAQLLKASLAEDAAKEAFLSAKAKGK